MKGTKKERKKERKKKTIEMETKKKCEGRRKDENEKKRRKNNEENRGRKQFSSSQLGRSNPSTRRMWWITWWITWRRSSDVGAATACFPTSPPCVRLAIHKPKLPTTAPSSIFSHNPNSFGPASLLHPLPGETTEKIDASNGFFLGRSKQPNASIWIRPNGAPHRG